MQRFIISERRFVCPKTMDNLDCKVLLEISRATATAREAGDLLRLVMERIRPLFGFYDAGIFVLDKTGDYHRDLTVQYPNVTPSEADERLHAAGLWGWLPHRGSLIEHQMGLCEQSRTPLVFSYEQMCEEFPDYPFLEAANPGGFGEFLGTLLRVRGETVGIFYLNSLEKGFFKPAQFPLFEAIADQVAIAVSNILANQEIIEREREKTLLLSLSEDMATIRDREDLWRVMMEKINLLLPFGESPQVFVLNPDGATMRTLLISPSPEAAQTAEFQHSIRQNFSFAETPFEESLNAVAPQIFSYEYFRRRYPDYWGTKIWEQVGIKESLFVQLRSGGVLLGSFGVLSRAENTFSAAQFSLFKSVADQVAVAVANILANEEIAQLAEERRARAEELARTNDAVQRSTFGLSSLANIERFLESVLAEIIRETEARGTGVFQLAPDGERLRLTHYLEGSEMFDVATDPRLAVWRGAKSIGQTAAAERMAKGELLWIRRGAVDFGDDWAQPLAAHWQAGHEIIACVPFVIGGKFTGFVGISFGEAVNPTEQKMQMCQTLAQHAALAIEMNRLAGEFTLSAVAREQERAAQERAAKLAEANELLRASVETLTSAENLDRFLGFILLAITRQLNAGSSTVWLNDNEKQISHLKFLVENNAIIPAAEAEQHPNRHAPAALGGEIQETPFTPTDRSEPQMRHVCDTELAPRMKNYLLACGINYMLCVPMVLGGEHLGSFVVRLEEKRTFADEDLELVQALANQATLALQIARLNGEATREAEHAAVLKDRNRIAGDIHDTLAQSFTGIVVQLQAAERAMRNDAGKINADSTSFKHLETAIKVAREGLREARRSVQALRPRFLDDADFIETARRLLDRMTDGSDVKGEFRVSGEPRPLAENVSISLMRICQEAITNAARHAAANNISVELSFDGDREVRLTITDDGAGFDAAGALTSENQNRRQNGFGLDGMKTRASQIGATLAVKSAPGKGTRILVRCCQN